MVNSPPCNEEDIDSIPDPGGSHMLQQLSSCATTTEIVLWNLWTTAVDPMHSECWSPHGLETAHDPQQEKPPRWEMHWPQLEKVHAYQPRHCIAKNWKQNVSFLKSTNTNVGEDVEKRELWYTVGETVNWCSYCENHYEVSLKTKNRTIIWSSSSNPL